MFIGPHVVLLINMNKFYIKMKVWQLLNEKNIADVSSHTFYFLLTAVENNQRGYNPYTLKCNKKVHHRSHES